MGRWIKGISLIVIFGLILVVAPQVKGTQGYILISFGHWSIEGTIVQFVAAITTTALIAYAVWLLVKYLVLTLVLPSKWWQNRAEQSNANLFQSGLDYMALGLWHQAAEQFLKVKKLSKLKTAQELAIVCSARANDEKLAEQIDKKLNIKQNMAEAEHEAHVARAHMLLQRGENEAAVELIKQHQNNTLKQSLPFQQLWFTAQIRLFNWQQVQKHFVKIESKVSKQYSADALNKWNEQLQQELSNAFIKFVFHFSVNQLQQVWQGFGRTLHKHPVMASSYIQALAHQQQTQLIEDVLVLHVSDSQWLLDNIRQVYQIMGKTPFEKLFEIIQKQLKKDGTNKVTLTTYAYLSAGLKDHQLAKQALEQTVHSSKHPIDTRLYADVLAEIGEVRHSVDVFKSIK
jgi:HemY protein